MPGGLTDWWWRLTRHFRTPTFQDFLQDSADRLREKPIRMVCPACKTEVPLANRCPNCGSPRHPPVDHHV